MSKSLKFPYLGEKVHQLSLMFMPVPCLLERSSRSVSGVSLLHSPFSADFRGQVPGAPASPPGGEGRALRSPSLSSKRGMISRKGPPWHRLEKVTESIKNVVIGKAFREKSSPKRGNMKISKQKPCLPRGRKGARSTLRGSVSATPDPWETPGPAPALGPWTLQAAERDGDLDLPAQGANPGLLPRKADSTTSAAREVPRACGAASTADPTAKCRPAPQAGGRFSPRPATAQPTRGRHSATNGEPPHCRLPAGSGGSLSRTALQPPFSSDRAFSLLCSALACGSPSFARLAFQFFPVLE